MNYIRYSIQTILILGLGIFNLSANLYAAKNENSQVILDPGVSTYQDVIRRFGEPERVKTEKKMLSDIDAGETLILSYPARGIEVGFTEKKFGRNPKIHSVGYRTPFSAEGPGRLRIGMSQDEAFKILKDKYEMVLSMENRAVFKTNISKKEEIFIIFSSGQVSWIKHFETSGLLPALVLMRLGLSPKGTVSETSQNQDMYEFFYASRGNFWKFILYFLPRVFSVRVWMILFGLLAAPAFFAVVISQFDSSFMSPEIIRWIQRIGFLILYIWAVLFLHHFIQKSVFLALIPAGLAVFLFYIYANNFKMYYRRKFGKSDSSREWICRNCGAVNDIILIECGACGAKKD